MPTILPPKLITAVDDSTDELTIVGHGFVTGDTFVGVWSPDGGAPPSPIVGTDDYWIIRVDDDTIQLAASSADAMAGNEIDLTDTGSGTLYLVKGLPYRRPRIAAPLTQVRHEDDNASWEALQALWHLLTGQDQDVWDEVKLAVPLTVDDLTVGGTLDVSGGDIVHGDRETTLSGAGWRSTVGTFSTGPVKTTSSGAGTLYKAIPAEVGKDIKTVTLSVLGNGATNITQLDLIKTTAAGVDSILATTSVSAPAASWQDVVLNAGPYELATGEALSVVAAVDGAGIALGNTRLAFDRPPP